MQSFFIEKKRLLINRGHQMAKKCWWKNSHFRRTFYSLWCHKAYVMFCLFGGVYKVCYKNLLLWFAIWVVNQVLSINKATFLCYSNFSYLFEIWREINELMLNNPWMNFLFCMIQQVGKELEINNSFSLFEWFYFYSVKACGIKWYNVIQR